MKFLNLSLTGDVIVAAILFVLLFVLLLAFVARYSKARFERKLAHDMRRRREAENWGLWRYSGFGIGEKNFMQDLGCVTDDQLRTRQEAREYCAAHFGTVVHVDDGNRIVTYKKASH